MGFILQYYKILLPQFNIFPSASTVLLHTHLRACLCTKLSCSGWIIHKLRHCMRPEVLAPVSTKISSLKYNTTLYNKNLSFSKGRYIYARLHCHIPKNGNFIKSAQMSLHNTNMAHIAVLRSIFQLRYPAFQEPPITLTTNTNKPLISKSGTSTA